MAKLSDRLSGLPLQLILIIGFTLTATLTIISSALITYNVIRNYLDEAANERVGRDMELATAFYNNKLSDILLTATRISTAQNVRNNLQPSVDPQSSCAIALEKAIDNELETLPTGTRRFVVVTDHQGRSVAGRVAWDDSLRDITLGTDWSKVPIIQAVLSDQETRGATEVLPAEVLAWLGLAETARVPLIDTPLAAPLPFDPREGTAGLVLVGVAPVYAETGEFLGSILVGHLFNGDFTLVDRIADVAGVDTSTIFFGDLRVSTNVLDLNGNRAIGTRLSQEVYQHVLVEGQDFTGRAFVVKEWYITRYHPIFDHKDQIVGILYVGAREATFNRLVESFAQRLLLIVVATILLAILIAIPFAYSISRPTTQLVNATQQVAQGDWSVRVPVSGYQEMQNLAGSFNTMVETLKETQEQLIQKEKLASVGQLAAGVAHEINNPLGSVLLYADILCKETPEENAQQREDLQMIIREATRCKTIVNDLLNFSRQNEVLAQDTDLNSLLVELAEAASKQDLYDQVEIKTDLDPDLGTIQADPLQLHQVFINLMNNAAEAMPDGGVLTLKTRQGPTPDWVTVEVTDTGVGIPEENLNKMFTPFFTTKPIGKGTGLGLAIIYGIVKMHRGQISFKSQVGEGTTFTLQLRQRLPNQMANTTNSFVLP
jgi:two-component system NtrC family sensor kinase